MTTGGSNWFRQLVALAAIALGVSTAGTLISNAANEPTTRSGMPAPAAVASATAAIPDASRWPVTDLGRPLAMLANYIQPAVGGPVAGSPVGAADPVAALSQLATTRDVSVHFLIATVPDWVDSSLRWTFDPAIDSIQMAAGQLGYVPVAFHLPDADALMGTGNPPPTVSGHVAHESEPGAILFRGTGPDAGREVLLVLLVGESVIGGVHPRALASAVRLAAAWHPQSQDGPIRILGPTYSGSADSLRVMLRDLHDASPAQSARFAIVTPSASSPENRALLNIDGVATFRSTTRSDDEVMAALARFLGRTDHGWRCGKRVALLVEANTTWGRRFFLQDTSSASHGVRGKRSRSESQIAKDTACWSCMHSDPDQPFRPGESMMPCATVLPFPLHVSRLRSEATRAARTVSGVDLPTGAAVRLPLNDPLVSTDRVPSATPVLTAANVETMLEGVFRTINERDVTAVGVLATDKRDHLFLAEQIARRTPNVLPFTIESNLIYLHPDVSSYLRGTVIASTYAVNDRTQFLTRPTLANHLRHQFASSAAEGTYNALLVLMGAPGQLLDYDSPAGPSQPVPAFATDGPCQPGHVTCRPPVWISVAGRGSLIPVTSSPPLDGLDADYSLFAVNRTPFAQARPQQDYIGSHGLFYALVAALVGLLAWHDWQVRRHGLQRLDSGIEALDAERRAGCFAREGAMIGLALWLVKLGLVEWADAHHQSVLASRYWYAVLACVAGVGLVARAVWALWGWPPRGFRSLLAVAALASTAGLVARWCLLDMQDARETTFQLGCATGLLACFADVHWSNARAAATDVAHWRRMPVLLGLGAVICLLCHLAIDAWLPVEAILYVDRTGALGSLVSPAPIIVVLCVAVYWWGAWNLRRVQLMRLPETEVGIGDLLQRRARRGGTQPVNVFEQPSLTVGAFMLLPAFLTVYAFMAGHERVGSIDGRLFGGFLLLGAMCILSIAGHTLAHTLHLGAAVLATLKALGRHPAARIFEAIGKENFIWHMSFQEITALELEPLARRVERASAAGSRWQPEDRALLASCDPDHVARWRDCAARVAHALGKEPTERSHEALGRDEWQQLNAMTHDFYGILRRTIWRADYDAQAGSPAFRETLEHMEYVVMFHGAVVLRDLLTRVVSGFTAVLGALLMLMVGHLLYTFQGREFWLMLDWCAIGTTSLVGVRMLASLDKDFVLSRLWNTTPGQISIFGGLSWRMVGYAAASLISLLAAFFPEVGGSLGQWLEPIRKLAP